MAIDPNYQNWPRPLYQKSGSGYQITDYAGVVASVGPGFPPFITVGYNPQAQGRPGKIHQELNQMFLGGGGKASSAT